MVNIDITYQGGLRCEAIHELSGATLLTDAPLDNHGQGRSFSPTDLLATSMGTCMLTTMGILAQRDGIDLAGSKVHVTKQMSSTSPRRVARLTVTFTIPTTLTPEQQKRLESAAKACPVHHSLSSEVETVVTFNWA